MTTYTCDMDAYRCRSSAREELPAPPGRRSTTVNSPDGTKTVFIRDHNLWMRELNSGEETPLT